MWVCVLQQTVPVHRGTADGVAPATPQRRRHPRRRRRRRRRRHRRRRSRSQKRAPRRRAKINK